MGKCNNNNNLSFFIFPEYHRGIKSGFSGTASKKVELSLPKHSSISFTGIFFLHCIYISFNKIM